MSFVLWYKIKIAEAGGTPAGRAGLGLPLTVSNDVLSGSLVVDADITVTMTDGAAADTFEVSLINLPAEATDLLKNTHATTPVNATIQLGYFDEPTTRTDAGRVLVGRVMSVTGHVGDDGLSRTVLYGQEEGGYLLRNTSAQQSRPDNADPLELARALATAAGIPLADGSTAGKVPATFAVRTGSTLDALGTLAAGADIPLVVRDRQVYLGDAVGTPADAAPVVFDPNTNLVSLSSSTVEDTAARAAFPASPAMPPVRTTVDLTVLGHPGLRVGQVAAMTGLSGVPTGPLRLSHVTHSFLVGEGYTARLRLVAAGAGERVQVATGAQGLVDRWRDVVDRARDDHPAVDLGEVSGYTAERHLASLHYGQEPLELHDKPVASVFAFHRTGLVTPVYPKMRAVLAHNRSQVDDAVITGFLWPDEPDGQRPAARDGDYWLALPTELDSDGLPTGKGANDLTDATGHRVIQVAGLHVLVGAKSLPEVGTRPTPPADDSITVEHQSGTRITVDPDGAVTIRTSGAPITLTNGSVSMKLDGPTVAVT